MITVERLNIKFHRTDGRNTLI